jgi:lipoate---protein ligase
VTVNEDLLLAHAQTRLPQIRIYEPEELCVVLGAGRPEEGDVDLAAAAADGVPVLRRKGGGGTVLLGPGQAVLAMVTEVASPFRNREYAGAIADWCREALEGLGVGGIEHRGISDLAIRDRKILGASIYRSKLVLFYQASILVDTDTRLFSRYLRYPSRVPEYRGGRSHEEFCTTLAAEGYPVGVSAVLEALRSVAERELPRFL